MKQITFYRDDVKRGIDTVCKAISQTLGPRGRNSFIDNEMAPLITNDGKSTADAITLEGFENMGAWLVKNTCDKTFEDVGDATTTTAILLQSIISEGMKRPENPTKIKKSLKEIGKKVEQWIKDESSPVKDSQIESVASVAAESKVIGKLIAEIIKKVGKKTPIYVDENAFGTEIDYVTVDGMETRNGYVSSNDAVIEMENVSVFVTDKKINSLVEIQKVLNTFDTAKVTSPVLIVPDIDETVYKAFVRGKEMGLFSYVVIRAKGTDIFDMAAVCGATVISSKNGLDFKDVEIKHLGLAKKVIVHQDRSLIVSDETPTKTKAIDDLKILLAGSTNFYEKQILTKRIEALSGGIAIIRVAAPTDSERRYLRLKILNAVNTTKMALTEGIVPGAGLCLYRISNMMKGNSIGEEILKLALKEPLKNIIENAGEDYAVITRKMGGSKGYDADSNKVVDVSKCGIIDSAKSTRCAFVNALSSASEFLTVGVSITNKKDETNRK